MIIKPPRLCNGDKIGVVAPGGPVQMQKLQKGIEYLKNKGFDVSVGKYLVNNTGYLAGTDKERLEDFTNMIVDPNVKAIFFARGGYGTQRILHLLDYDLVKNNPKIIVGYSDATALQLAIYHRTNLVTFSGPMVATDFCADTIPKETETHLWELLNKIQNAHCFHSYNSGDMTVLQPGYAEGPLICGCLSVLLGCLGTSFCPDFHGAILVLEDIGEDEYKIDRAFTTLRHHGIFQKINGLIIGRFVQSEHASGEAGNLDIKNIVKPLAKEFDIPTLSDFNYGHVPKKLTLPIGAAAKMDTYRKTFELLEHAVN